MALAAAGVAILSGTTRAEDVAMALILLTPAVLCLRQVLWYVVGGERVVIAPSAMVRKRSILPPADVFLLDEISTIVVTGEGDDARLDVQLGRRRLQILKNLGYGDSGLRWTAKRLRSAIERARSTPRQNS